MDLQCAGNPCGRQILLIAMFSPSTVDEQKEKLSIQKAFLCCLIGPCSSLIAYQCVYLDFIPTPSHL